MSTQRMYGPTPPLRLAAPTSRDVVESDTLVESVMAFSVPSSVASVLRFVESVGMLMGQRTDVASLDRGDADTGVLPTPPPLGGHPHSATNFTAQSAGDMWAKAFAFGSSGLDANVVSSDVDVYVG